MLGAVIAVYFFYGSGDRVSGRLPSAGARLADSDQAESAAPTYRVTFSCGHAADFSPEQLFEAGLDFMVYDFARSTVALPGSTAQQVVLSGQVPVLCQDCRTCYLVGEQDGYVAVFRGRDKASAVFLRRYPDMPISRLPEDVQQRLRDGILVHSDEELARVLEGLDG